MRASRHIAWLHKGLHSYTSTVDCRVQDACQAAQRTGCRPLHQNPSEGQAAREVVRPLGTNAVCKPTQDLCHLRYGLWAMHMLCKALAHVAHLSLVFMSACAPRYNMLGQHYSVCWAPGSSPCTVFLQHRPQAGARFAQWWTLRPPSEGSQAKAKTQPATIVCQAACFSSGLIDTTPHLQLMLQL